MRPGSPPPTEAPRRPRRSLLFFPADRPDRYPKALASGADAVCIDLEDAVAPAKKDEGRAGGVRLLGEIGSGRAETVLRINSPRTETGLRDLLALCQSGAAPAAVVIPKVDDPAEVAWVESILEPRHPDVRLIPMVETGRGLAVADRIAAATPRVSALLFGGVDLSAELGAAREWDALLYARSRVVHAAATARVDVLDMPFLDVPDGEGLRAEAGSAARLGFTGKIAIHPRQIEAIHSAFSPGEEEIARAREIVAAYERNRGGVLLVDGRLVERPVVRAAQRTLAIARAEGAEP